MKKEFVIAIVILATVGVIAFMLVGRNQSPATPNQSDISQVGEENTVVYSDSGYSPSELTVQVGTKVTFVSQSDLPMWTASNPHPIHTNYPDFDPRQGVAKGESYEFTFNEAGSYEYHNHLSPQHNGKITVE